MLEIYVRREELFYFDLRCQKTPGFPLSRPPRPESCRVSASGGADFFPWAGSASSGGPKKSSSAKNFRTGTKQNSLSATQPTSFPRIAGARRRTWSFVLFPIGLFLSPVSRFPFLGPGTLFALHRVASCTFASDQPAHLAGPRPCIAV